MTILMQNLPVHDKAALLDADAYDYIYGKNWSQTVPAGETWYALNLWFVQVNGDGPFFHRRLDVDNALALTAGTVISANSIQAGFAYICKPSKVSYADPEAVFSDRVDALNTIKLTSIKSAVPVNTAPAVYTGAAFPQDFDQAMLRYVSTNDLCWTIVVGNATPGMPGHFDSMNTHEEINDNHVIRFTGNILCPIKRSKWNGIWTQSASKSGNYSQLSDAGTGVVLYQKLPANW